MMWQKKYEENTWKHQISGVKCRSLDIFPVAMLYVIMMLIIIDMTIDCWLLMINQCCEMVEAELLVWILAWSPIVLLSPKPTTSNGSFGTFASVIFWYLLFTSCRGPLFARKMCPDDVLNHASTNEAFLWHNFSFLPGNGQWSMAKAGHQCRQKTQAGFGGPIGIDRSQLLLVENCAVCMSPVSHLTTLTGVSTSHHPSYGTGAFLSPVRWWWRWTFRTRTAGRSSRLEASWSSVLGSKPNHGALESFFKVCFAPDVFWAAQLWHIFHYGLPGSDNPRSRWQACSWFRAWTIAMANLVPFDAGLPSNLVRATR